MKRNTSRESNRKTTLPLVQEAGTKKGESAPRLQRLKSKKESSRYCTGKKDQEKLKKPATRRKKKRTGFPLKAKEEKKGG